MPNLKEGHIVPLKNVKFTIGEYADGYMGVPVIYRGQRVLLRFTPGQFQTMLKSAVDNMEDFEAYVEDGGDCGLFAWIGHELSALLGKK